MHHYSNCSSQHCTTPCHPHFCAEINSNQPTIWPDKFFSMLSYFSERHGEVKFPFLGPQDAHSFHWIHSPLLFAYHSPISQFLFQYVLKNQMLLWNQGKENSLYLYIVLVSFSCHCNNYLRETVCVSRVGMLAQSYRGMSPYWRIECDFPSQYLGDTVYGPQKEAGERYIPKNTPPVNYFLQLHPHLILFITSQ